MQGVDDGQREKQGGGVGQKAVFMKVLYIYVLLHMCARI
jgi:hypothetical protein